MSIGIQTFRMTLLGSLAALPLLAAGIAAYPSSAAADQPAESPRTLPVGYCLGRVTESAVTHLGETPHDFAERLGITAGEWEMQQMADCAVWGALRVVRPIGPVW